MAPKRTTRSTPAAIATTPTTVTDAQLKVLIDQGIANTLAARDADRTRNGEDIHDSGMGVRRQALHAHECTYPDFMKCKPLYFKGTKRVHAYREKQHQPEDIQELLHKLLKDLQIIREELANYINTPNLNYLAFYDDDETESDEVIKFSVEDLVPIPSESEVISDDTCDVPFCDNSPPLDVLNDHFEIFSNFNDDCTSSDDDSFEDIDYVEASPPNSELVSLEDVKDDILREKLLNINLLIAKIESLNDNPTPDCVLKSPSPFPIPVEDSDSFFEKSDTSLSYSDNSLPEFETFSDHTEETSSGSTTTH
ncbi:hypothetical protein Tco_0957669, partial [Tanacetum coccineum]